MPGPITYWIELLKVGGYTLAIKLSQHSQESFNYHWQLYTQQTFLRMTTKTEGGGVPNLVYWQQHKDM